MSWWSSKPKNDDARWSTSVHEASHIVSARKSGGRARAWVSGNGRRGGFTADMPDSAPRTADAIAHLAGGIGQRRIVGRDGPSPEDLRNARKALKGTGMSLSEAKREARKLVDRSRGEIEREARLLDGR